MYLIRTVPKNIPEGRNYVVDSIDRVEIGNYDMRFLADLDDAVVMLEWDIAVAQHDLFNFMVHCEEAPHLVHVAPYPLYPISTGLDSIEAPVWAHRDMIHENPLQLKWIDFGDPVCEIFSTGMIYFPLEILKRIRESDDLIVWHTNINDSKLAFWYYHTIGKKIPVHWDVRPIHLHYNQEEIYERFGRRIRGPHREFESSGQHSLG